jgi:hypothetical protein
MIFVYVCSTWSIVKLKTRFEAWITWNDLNGLSLFHLSYIITPMLTCAHNGHKKLKSRILCLIGSSTDYLF